MTRELLGGGRATEPNQPDPTTEHPEPTGDGRYRSAFDSMLEGVQIVDADWRYTYVNDAAARHGQRTKDELIGKTMMEAYPGIERTELFAVLRRCLAERAPERLENEFTFPDGSNGWFELSVEPVPGGLLILSIDVSLRKKADEELHRRQERIEHLNAVLRGIRNVNQIIVREKDADTLVQKACECLVEARGYFNTWIALGDPSGALLVKGRAGLDRAYLGTMSEVTRVDGFRCVVAAMHRSGVTVIEDPASTCAECPLSKKKAGRSAMTIRLEHDGRVFGVLVASTVPGFAIDPEEHALLVEVAEDLGLALHSLDQETKRHQAEQRLGDTQQLYKTLVETSPDAIILADLKGTILMCNQKAAALYGDERPEVLIGKAGFDIIAPEDRERAAANLQKVLDRGRLDAVEYAILRKDGSRYTGQLSVAVMTDRDGAPKGLIGVLRDVSASKSMEQQLHAAQRMEAVGRLAGGVAHDFNNLLTVIQSFSSFIIDALDPRDPACEDAREILKAAESATKLTRQLLAFGRRQVMQPVVLDLNEVVTSLEKILRRVIGEDVELATVLEGNLGFVLTDAAQIEQVFMNLAVNARDAMPKGGKLTIETTNVVLDEEYAGSHPAVTPGPFVMLAMSDTGTGMSAEVKDRIFEPFFTTKPEGKGTGLGLATVYGIVKQNGGNIWVYSELGGGTSFKIYLPRVDAEAATALRAELAVTTTRGTETILVVEDDPLVLRATARILRKHGYTVLEAASGGDALLILERHAEPIALVFTDIVMPLMSGRELADRVKTSRPALPVLFTSGYTDNAIVHHGVLDADTIFVEKPFTEEKLLRKVREALAGSPASP